MMPALLHFYQGAITRSDYWDMPGDELGALIDYRDAWVRAQQQG